MKNLLLYIGIGAFLMTIGIGIGVKMFSDKYDRAITNFKSDLAGIKYSQDSSRTDTKMMKMTVGEIKELYPGLKEELKQDLDIKLRNALYIIKTGSTTNTNFKTFVRDSTIKKNQIAEVADWQDKWSEFHWFKPYDSDTAAVIFQTTDSVLGALHKVPRTFREWWNGEKKKYNLTLKNFNPNSIINRQQIIQVEK
jgi:hypothetical protein